MVSCYRYIDTARKESQCEDTQADLSLQWSPFVRFCQSMAVFMAKTQISMHLYAV